MGTLYQKHLGVLANKVVMKEEYKTYEFYGGQRK